MEKHIMKHEPTHPKKNVVNLYELSEKLNRLLLEPDASNYSLDDMVEFLSEWTHYRQVQDMWERERWTGTEDWDVRFLKWAIKGRVKEFVQYCEDHPSPESKKALEGVWSIYDLKWPHSAVTGYMFGYTWGWLQLELEKPGEEPPMTIEEQRASLIKDCEKRGVKIKNWLYDGYGGVKAITDEDGPKLFTQEQ